MTGVFMGKYIDFIWEKVKEKLQYINLELTRLP